MSHIRLGVHAGISLVLVVGFLCPPGMARAALGRTDSCGTWSIQSITNSKDDRIEAALISGATGALCRGSVRLINKTGPLGLGGYTFETNAMLSNATVDWTPKLDTEGRQYLLPPLHIELHSLPVDPTAPATVTIQGEMTVRAFSIDLSLFLFRTGLALIPGSGCLISDEQLMFAVLRSSDILGTAAHLSFARDFIGARDELKQVLPEFYSRMGASLKDAGVGCAVDLVQSIIKKPLAIIKIAVAYLTWIPVVLIDDFKYSGRTAVVVLAYTPPVIQPAPLDRKDSVSVLQWLLYAAKMNDPAIFGMLVNDGDLFYASQLEGGQSRSKAEFLADMAARLPSKPECVGYVSLSSTVDNLLMIWFTNWKPAWEMTEICYGGCTPLSPPLESSVAALQFRMTDQGWTLHDVWLNDFSNWQAGDPYHLPLLDCHSGLPTAPSQTQPAPDDSQACAGAPPPRLTASKYAYVNINPPLANRVRNGPGRQYKVIGNIQPGQVMEVVAGPECSSGSLWWQIRALTDGLTGWTAEGDLQTYWLVPCNVVAACKP